MAIKETEKMIITFPTSIYRLIIKLEERNCGVKSYIFQSRINTEMTRTLHGGPAAPALQSRGLKK